MAVQRPPDQISQRQRRRDGLEPPRATPHRPGFFGVRLSPDGSGSSVGNGITIRSYYRRRRGHRRPRPGHRRLTSGWVMVTVLLIRAHGSGWGEGTPTNAVAPRYNVTRWKLSFVLTDIFAFSRLPANYPANHTPSNLPVRLSTTPFANYVNRPLRLTKPKRIFSARDLPHVFIRLPITIRNAYFIFLFWYVTQNARFVSHNRQSSGRDVKSARLLFLVIFILFSPPPPPSYLLPYSNYTQTVVISTKPIYSCLRLCTSRLLRNVYFKTVVKHLSIKHSVSWWRLFLITAVSM